MTVSNLRIRPRAAILELTLLGAVSVAVFTFLRSIALDRFIARDEGFYVMAAKLVASGQTLYHDFFFTQMPFLVELYSRWLVLTGFSWNNARLLSVVFTTLIAMLLYLRALNLFGTGLALIGVALFTTSHMVFAWFTIVETFALSSLLLFLAYLVLMETPGWSPRGRMFVVGVLLGLASATRLFFAGAAPFFALYIIDQEGKDRRAAATALLWLSLGFLVALLPALILAYPSFERFWFNNLGYHLTRYSQGFLDSMHPKWTITKTILGIRMGRQFLGPSFAVLCYLSILYAAVTVWRRARMDLAVVLAIVLFLLNLIPTPSYNQYFCTLSPFLVISALFPLNWVLSGCSKRFGNAGVCLSYALVCGILTLCLYDLPSNVRKFTRTGDGVPGVGISKNPKDYTIRAVQQVSEVLDQHAQPGERVLTLWPGYLLSSHTTPFPGLENHFGLDVGDRLDPDQRRFLRVASRAEVIELVRGGRAPLAAFSEREVRRYLRGALVDGGYEKVGEVVSMQIYRRTAASNN